MQTRVSRSLLLGMAVLVAGAFLGYVLQREWGDTYELTLSGVALTWDRRTTPARTVPHDDKVTLTVQQRTRTVRGETTARTVLPDGTEKTVSWDLQGHLVGDLLAMTYGTRSAHTQGIGAYFLVRHGDDYVGYTLVRDRGETVWCPYAAQVSAKTATTRRSAEDWGRLYPKLLQQDCRHVPLNPDRIPSGV